MASANDKIREVLGRYGEPFTEGQGGNVWRVQGTPVISHRCLERIAAQAGIVFEKPTILRAERDEAVIMVAGSLDKRSEWSIGEALVNVNYRVSGKQAAYVYAMAEKRGKDRVILKLVELHGLAYSEEEADEFKTARPARSGDPGDRAQYEIDQDEAQRPAPMSVEHMLHEISQAHRPEVLADLKSLEAFRAGYLAADEVSRQRIKQALAKAAEECAA